MRSFCIVSVCEKENPAQSAVGRKEPRSRSHTHLNESTVAVNWPLKNNCTVEREAEHNFN